MSFMDSVKNVVSGGATGAADAQADAADKASAISAENSKKARKAIRRSSNKADKILRGSSKRARRTIKKVGSATSLMAALSGVRGADAQSKAYADFNDSPGQSWLQEQGSQALLRSSAALGGLGGGRIREALQQQAIGISQQDFGNYYNRISDMAGLQNQRKTNIANMFTSTGTQRANIAQGKGTNMSNVFTGQAAQQSDIAMAKGAAEAGGITGMWGGIQDAFKMGAGALGGAGSLEGVPQMGEGGWKGAISGALSGGGYL